jgi:sugar O-acyltransferase (sialic acid O-acetyltransferase NeuD family)
MLRLSQSSQLGFPRSRLWTIVVTMDRRPEHLVIVGAGGFGREVADIARDLEAAGEQIRLLGYLDDGRIDELRLRAIHATVIGTSARLRTADVGFVVAIGLGSVRSSIIENIGVLRAVPVTLISPKASVGTGTTLGPGCIMAAGARVTTGCVLGEHVNLHINASVGHDCRFDDFSTVFPGAVIGGDVHIEREATIGAGAVVLRGLTIGTGAMVGAGAVVTRDVAPGDVVVGAPARSLDRQRVDW